MIDRTSGTSVLPVCRRLYCRSMLAMAILFFLSGVPLSAQSQSRGEPQNSPAQTGDPSQPANDAKIAIDDSGSKSTAATTQSRYREINETFLDNLSETKSEVGYGVLGKLGSTGYPKEAVQRCRIGDTELKHALSIHPNQEGVGFVTYSLNKRYQILRATAAMHKPLPKDGMKYANRSRWKGMSESPIRFRIFGDSKLLWESKPMRSHVFPQDFEVDIEDVTELRLECKCEGSSNFAYAFFGNPRVLQREPILNSEEGADIAGQPIVFRQLTLPEPATSMALTEDGKFLVVTHQLANLVSVWDVLNDKLLKSFVVSSPRSVICRGDFVFIVNHADDTISQISRSKDWTVVKKLEVEGKKIDHISAAQGTFFKGELLATCHGHHSLHVLIDITTGKQKGVQGPALAMLNYDGKLILTQTSFENSPSGTIDGYPKADFFKPGAQSVINGGRSDQLYVTQHHTGSYWYGGNTVLAGQPSLALLPIPDNTIVVPDLSQRILYTLGRDRFYALKLDSSLTQIGTCKVEWATMEKNEPYAGIVRATDRQRGYLLDEPLGYTHSDQLHLFAINTQQNQIWTARTRAWAKPLSPVERVADSGVTNAKTSVDPTPGMPQENSSSPKPEARKDAVDPIAIRPLTLAEPATSMALMEDGRQLIISHSAANQLTVWDVLTEKETQTLEVSSPRSVLCRGDSVFVVSNGEGKISQFSRAKNWELINEFAIDKKLIVHISAPHGSHFKDEIVISCHGGGPEGSYQGNSIILLNIKNEKQTVLPRLHGVFAVSLATFSYDGRVLLLQSSFNLSPGGIVTAFPAADAFAGNAQSLFSIGLGRTHSLLQDHPGSYWYGSSKVVANGSQVTLDGTQLGMVIPDLSQRVFYSIDSKHLVARQLNTSLTEIAKRDVAWPDEDEKFYERVSDIGGRHRAYIVDGPFAFTHPSHLYFFMIDGKSNQVCIGKTSPLVKPTETGVQIPASTAIASGTVKASESLEPDPMSQKTNEWGLPVQVVEGTDLHVQMKGPLNAEYELITGPDGLKLSKSGQIAWLISAKQLGKNSLKFRLRAGPKISIVRTDLEVIGKEIAAKINRIPTTGEPASEIAESRGDHLELDLDHGNLMPVNHYSSLLLLQGDRLRELGPDGLKVLNDRKLPNRYRFLAARGDQFLAVANEGKQLDVINSKTLAIKKTIPFDQAGIRILEVCDLEPHPFRPVTYVAVKHDIEVPRFRILVVDEATGKVDAPEEMIGTWIKVDPAGKFLYSGYEDIYQRGSTFHVNPGLQIIEMPKYGHIDWLVSYDLRKLKPRFHELLQNVGGNGSGIVLSADGKRLSYTSHVGSPPFSGNLLSWNPQKLKDSVVSYPVKGKGDPNMLAYHPTLPFVAVPGSGSAVLFDREKGTELTNKLQLTSSGLGKIKKVEQLLFSPDGTGLIFVCSDQAGRYIRRVGLNLTNEERSIAAKGVPKFEETPLVTLTPRTNLIKVNESEIDALKPAPNSKPLTVKEIGRRYLNSIVVIKSESGSGTGFVVGKQGLIMTCAHVIPEDGEITVSYNFIEKNQKLSTTVKAKVVRIDQEQDLALVKIEKSALIPVVLGDDATIEAGEDVTVIGNPGLGKEILEYSITTGIVSNARRIFDELEYIQTSAAVNPGNSGGPMFDPTGRVVGLVVSRAKFNEATAFAIPTKVVRKFLRDATVSKK